MFRVAKHIVIIIKHIVIIFVIIVIIIIVVDIFSNSFEKTTGCIICVPVHMKKIDKLKQCSGTSWTSLLNQWR